MENIEGTFSLEENLRQRDYYEKYYEDLAAHAARMDQIGQHEIAEQDRKEMQNVSRILGDLVAEKQENYDREAINNAQTNHEMANSGEKAQSELNMDQESEHLQSQQETNQTAFDQESIRRQVQGHVEDIPEEDLIPADKSHFTEEALEAEARADEQLATEEAAMDAEIKQYYAEFDEQPSEEMGENITNPSNAVEKDQEIDQTLDGKVHKESETFAEQEDNDYGYGM